MHEYTIERVAMKPKFSIRGMLVTICVCSICLVAILNPNLRWVSAVRIASGILLACAVAVAIGSNGRLRIQTVAFVVLAVVSLYQSKNDASPFATGVGILAATVNDVTGSGIPRRGPKGERVLFNGESYSIEFPDNKWNSVSETEIQKRKLEPYVYTWSSIVSPENLLSVLTSIIALAVGWMGLLIAGFCYDRRKVVGETS